jgi:hypothetical protein
VPIDLQFPLSESTLYEVFHFWQDIFGHVASEFGSNGTKVRVAPPPDLRIRNSASQGRETGVVSPRNPAAASGGAPGERLQAIMVTIGDF